MDKEMMVALGTLAQGWAAATELARALEGELRGLQHERDADCSGVTQTPEWQLNRADLCIWISELEGPAREARKTATDLQDILTDALANQALQKEYDKEIAARYRLLRGAE